MDTPEILNKYDIIQAELKKTGLKALFRSNKSENTEIWGKECLFCGQFWDEHRRPIHTKLCKNPDVDVKYKAYATYARNEETGAIEKID